MKATILTENIRNAFTIAERSTGKNLQLPIVSYILVEVDKNKVKIASTNLEQGLTISVLAKVEKEGKIAVPARMTSQFLSTVKEEKVELETVSRMLKIKTDRYQASIQGLEAESFPLIPKFKEPFLFEIQSSILTRSLAAVSIASAVTDFRQELQSVFFRFDPETALTFAATDSFRLSESVIPRKDLAISDIKEAGKTADCIVPSRTVSEVIKIAAEKGGNVKIGIDANQISFLWEDVEFISRLLEGEFPNYRAIIPSTFSTRCVINRRQFIDVLKLAGVFTTKLNDVKLKIKAEKNEISFDSKDASKGDYEGKIGGEISGGDLDVSFNYQFLLDGLEKMEYSENVFFGLNQENTPALIRPEGNEFYNYVVMPIRV